MNKKRMRSLICLTLAALLLNACSFGKRDSVVVQLSWFHGAEFAGFYSAVESGSAQFGVAPGDSLLVARAQGQDVLAVSAIYRANPLIVMSLKDSSILTPEDLIGKRVGVISADLSSPFDKQFLAMLRNLDIDKNSMTFVLLEDYNGADDIKSGRMDAMSGMFATLEILQAQLNGDAMNAIYYKDYGVDIYANPIFTTSAFANANPDLVSRFVRATLKGYQYAIENPAQAVDAVMKQNPALDKSLQAAAINAEIPVIATGDRPVGYMDKDVWESTQQNLLNFGLISQAIDINSIYTDQFLPK
ncbi:MAG: ABC transporter substrate-binding protein [Anaerolineales bacterium]|nr:ABC transporter substrate-binding protein [Anaerolineales bacterium]